MGDNIYLGDRDGVRTPMQWSIDRNGGFSRADPAGLVMPPIMDPIYGYQAVNVEAQSADQHSLLNWMRRMLEVRKGHRAFGRGTQRFLFPGNRKVLAYLRSHPNEDGQDETLAVRVQPVALGAGGGARPARVHPAGAGRRDRRLGVPADRPAHLPADPAAVRVLLVPAGDRAGAAELAHADARAAAGPVDHRGAQHDDRDLHRRVAQPAGARGAAGVPAEAPLVLVQERDAGPDRVRLLGAAARRPRQHLAADRDHRAGGRPHRALLPAAWRGGGGERDRGGAATGDDAHPARSAGRLRHGRLHHRQLHVQRSGADRAEHRHRPGGQRAHRVPQDRPLRPAGAAGGDAGQATVRGAVEQLGDHRRPDRAEGGAQGVVRRASGSRDLALSDEARLCQYPADARRGDSLRSGRHAEHADPGAGLRAQPGRRMGLDAGVPGACCGRQRGGRGGRPGRTERRPLQQLRGLRAGAGPQAGAAARRVRVRRRRAGVRAGNGDGG